MEKHSLFAKVVYLLAIIATIIGFTAFSQEPGNNNSFRKEQLSKDDSARSDKSTWNDRSGNMDQLDVQLNHLDVQMKHLDEQMKHLNEQMQHLDFSKTQKELDQAMKNLDKEKIAAQMDQSIKNIDWKAINRQMEKDFAKADKIHVAEAKKQIEKVRAQIEKQKINMRFSVPEIDTKKIRLQTEKAMKNAKKSIEKAKEEIQNMRDFTDALQTDGLIDKSKPYKVEVKEGELYINGNKQSKEVSDKYKRFYRKDNFTIDMNDEKRTRI